MLSELSAFSLALKETGIFLKGKLHCAFHGQVFFSGFCFAFWFLGFKCPFLFLGNSTFGFDIWNLFLCSFQLIFFFFVPYSTSLYQVCFISMCLDIDGYKSNINPILFPLSQLFATLSVFFWNLCYFPSNTDLLCLNQPVIGTNQQEKPYYTPKTYSIKMASVWKCSHYHLFFSDSFPQTSLNCLLILDIMCEISLLMRSCKPKSHSTL